MAKTSFENLLILTEESEFLDNIELVLRNNDQDALANNLSKLQQDAGVQLEVAFYGTDLKDVAPGIRTAEIRANYQEVTDERVTRDLSQYLSALEPSLQIKMRELISNFDVAPAPAQTHSAPKKPSL